MSYLHINKTPHSNYFGRDLAGIVDVAGEGGGCSRRKGWKPPSAVCGRNDAVLGLFKPHWSANPTAPPITQVWPMNILKATVCGLSLSLHS